LRPTILAAVILSPAFPDSCCSGQPTLRPP
jgi:hypothetical protein